MKKKTKKYNCPHCTFKNSISCAYELTDEGLLLTYKACSNCKRKFYHDTNYNLVEYEQLEKELKVKRDKLKEV